MQIIRYALLLSFFTAPLTATDLLTENNQISDDSIAVEKLYQLNSNEKWRDITSEVLKSSDTPEEGKEAIIAHHRRIILFQYPSDGLSIKGFLSFTPDPEYHPLLILFRWGNQKFALMNPGITLATYGDYTVISSALRGGVSEGKDEFGGADVNDMKNLIDFLPTIASEIGITLHPHCTFMLGPSRGGLEMFLTLSKYSGLQNKVDKVVALSSILDLHQQIQDRPDDMKPMFENVYGMNPDHPEKWIKARDPLETIPSIKQTLPILIVQGTEDPRINLAEGEKMVSLLKKTNHEVDYWKVPGGNHTLSNVPTSMNQISKWLEANLDCYRGDPRKYKK